MRKQMLLFGLLLTVLALVFLVKGHADADTTQSNTSDKESVRRAKMADRQMAQWLERMAEIEAKQNAKKDVVTAEAGPERRAKIAAQNTFSLSLDVDGNAGDQAVTSLNVSADQIVAIQIFGNNIQNANGLAVRFEYDASQVTYDGFDAGDVLPNAQALPEHGTNPNYVEIGIAALGGQATTNNGLVGTIRFRATAAFSGTAIRLVRAELSRGGRFETITLNTRIELQFQAVTPDFNGDGRVGFADFLAFGNQFGARQGDGKYDAKYDLDSDGAIGFGDFLIFSRSFGQEVSTPGGGEETQVTILDANLREVIETAQGKASGATITRGEMATLTSLTAPQKDILDLTGLEFAINLTSLNLSVNIISDITPLSGLTNLTSLNLSVNIISDITPLSGLTNLTSLNLSVNIISDITPLSGLTNLTSLNLSNNTITDISPLSGLTNLTSLRLHDNFFSDISPLSGLTNLTLLSLYDDTAITDRSVLSRLSNLSNLSEADIPDANLRAAIKIAMGKSPEDPITGFEMAFLSKLEAPNSNIGDLTGLEFAINLTRLGLGFVWVPGEGYVNSNHISDLSPLSGLTNLRGLNLYSNFSISDVSALSGLTNLTVLFLGSLSYEESNHISDLSPLSGLTSLTDLDIQSCNISDVSALSSLTNLTWLNLYDNSISDVSALAGLTNLTDLWLSYNSISDISALSGMTSLTWLNLYDNSISDISALSGMTSLTDLWLSNNSISDITPLSALTNLADLGLFNNSISDVSALSGLTSLTDLSLSNNSISDVSALANLTNLTKLRLDYNSISDISALSGMTSLTDLWLSGNSISDISALSGMTSLTDLWLSNNSISDVSALANLTNLTKLRLSNNSISDISALANLTNLTKLRLSNNSISDISALANLTNLTDLRLSSNSISDLAPLVANMGLDSGDRVDVRNNPLSATSINTHIPALQSRGVEVQFGASKPGVEEIEMRPTRAMMKPFGVREPKEGEYIYRR